MLGQALLSGGVIRGFGVAGETRHPLFPDITTSIEAGLPEYQSTIWFGLTAPKGLPQPVFAKLEDAVRKTLADPKIQKKFADLGGAVPAVETQGSKYMQKHVESEVARWVEYMGSDAAAEPAPAKQ